MAIERDPVTGRLTTGHEWNGIKELDTPVPRPVYFFLVVTTLFCIGYWLLMPAWPLGTTFTRGLLGADERAHVTAAVAEAARDRAGWTARFERADFAAIQADPRLMAIMRETGRTLFGDNCAMCHGRDGAGGPGFPSLRRGTPLWGAAPEEIAETLRVGINSTHPESRVAQMPAFGRDGILKRAEIEAVSTPSGTAGRARCRAGRRGLRCGSAGCWRSMLPICGRRSREARKEAHKEAPDEPLHGSRPRPPAACALARHCRRACAFHRRECASLHCLAALSAGLRRACAARRAGRPPRRGALRLCAAMSWHPVPARRFRR